MARLLVIVFVVAFVATALSQLVLPWQACEMECLKKNNATYPFQPTHEIMEHCQKYCQDHWQDMFKHQNGDLP